MSFTTLVDHDQPSGGSYIRLRSGAFIDLVNPDPGRIDINDIAHGLANVCRFGGHTAVFYSVADHCITISNMLLRQTGDKQLALKGLLHDASEAYIGDMVRPLKHAPGMVYYREVEANLEGVIAKSFGLDSLTDDLVKQADVELLAWEMAMYRYADWRIPQPVQNIKDGYLQTFHSLTES